VRLSLGRSLGVRRSARALGIAVLAVLVLLVLLYAVTVPRNIGDGGWTDGLVFVLITGLFAVAWYATGALAYALIGAGVSGTWLRGTRLRRRAGVRRTTIDLRTGDVRLDEDRTTLIATQPGGPARLEIPLRAGRLTLPADQLTALADALGDGFRDVADHLRTLAAQEAADPRPRST